MRAAEDTGNSETVLEKGALQGKSGTDLALVGFGRSGTDIVPVPMSPALRSDFTGIFGARTGLPAYPVRYTGTIYRYFANRHEKYFFYSFHLW